MSYQSSLSVIDYLQEETNKTARKMAVQIDQKVVLQTPRDTGRARANWLVYVDQPLSFSSIDAVDFAGNATINTGIQKIGTAKFKSWPQINIINGLPYIERLNQGWSAQAGSFYVDKIINGVVNG